MRMVVTGSHLMNSSGSLVALVPWPQQQSTDTVGNLRRQPQKNGDSWSGGER